MPIQELIQQLITYLRGIWRFRWYAMILAWLLSVSGWMVVMSMPDTYASSARVLVDTDSMLKPLLRGLTVQSNVGQRVRLMSQTLFSRPNLEKVARMTDLDITAENPDEMDELIISLKKKIKLKSTRRDDFYTISAEHKDPEMSKSIVQSLLTIFVEDSLGNSRKDSSSAQSFLEQQISEYEARLLNAETKIKLFKQKNINKMASSKGDYFQRLENEKVELEQSRLLYKEARIRRDELKRQIAGEEPVFGFGGGESIMQVVEHPNDARIEKLKAQLDELSLRFTKEHPSVVSRVEILKQLEEQRDEELSQMPPPVQQNTVTSLEQNPVYQQLKIALGQAEAEVSSLAVRVNEYNSRVISLKDLINTVPEVEAEFTALNRNYELTKKNYDVLVSRLESAKLSEEAQQTGDDVKFEVVEPPRIPRKPVGPKRILFSAATLILSFGIGIGLAFLLSQIRPTFYDQRTLRQISGYPVFGVVSRLWTPELLRKKRIEFGAFITTGCLLLLLFSGVIYLHIQGVTISKEMLETLRGWL